MKNFMFAALVVAVVMVCMNAVYRMGQLSEAIRASARYERILSLKDKQIAAMERTIQAHEKSIAIYKAELTKRTGTTW